MFTFVVFQDVVTVSKNPQPRFQRLLVYTGRVPQLPNKTQFY